MTRHHTTRAFFFLLLTIPIHLFFSCDRDSCVSCNRPEPLPGMVYLKSSGETAFLGSNLENAFIDEKPASSARFSYDFQMDTAEVTIGQYKTVMNTLPGEYDSIGIISDNLPVCYVSWFDAALFCNRRSKLNAIDTVYSYLSIDTSITGEVVKLTGLRINYQANGFRLPTEAEWIFAARGNTAHDYLWGDLFTADSAEKYSWYYANASSQPHPVATKAPNRFHIYDLEGNVSEWVNDKKMLFNGTEITDFAGGIEDGTPLRILKGGNFKLDMNYLRIASRSDLYPIESTSRNRYAGFRCAAGSIKTPFYLSNDNTLVHFEPVTLSRTSVASVLGTTNARLVFVNTSLLDFRTLCFIDFARQPLEVYQFTDQTDVYTPSLSPDGNWVAWSTADEGAITGGAVYVRNLNERGTSPVMLPDTPSFVPRWYVEPSTGDTFVLYVTSAQLNDQGSWHTAQTRMIKFSNGAFAEPPLTVVPDGAYHGGRSVDGTFIATGYPLLKMKNLVTGEEKTLFSAPGNGKKGTDTSQVCNVSISPDNTTPSQVLFLDFGSGGDTSTIIKSTYRTHEYIFRSDFSDSVLSFYKVPPPFDSWNHVEWSNRPNFAIATVTTPNGANRMIYAVNLADNTSAPLCEGTNLLYPGLWISPADDLSNTDLSLDSIGQYDDPHIYPTQGTFGYKLRRFWSLSSELDVVFVGSSVGADGIDPRYFTGVKGYNLSIAGADLATPFSLIEHYILPHCKNIRLIGMSFDPHMLFEPGGSADFYRALSVSKGYLYDRNHNYWKDGLPPQYIPFINALSFTPPEIPLNLIDSCGLIKNTCDGWGPLPLPVVFTDPFTIEDPNYQPTMDLLFSVISKCNAQGVKVIVVNFPLPTPYRDSEFHGPLGPPQTTMKLIVDDMKERSSHNSNMIFYDADLQGYHDYTEFEYKDAIHLCEEGAKKLSMRVDSCIQILLGQ